MRIRAGRVVATWVILAVSVSTVLTCVPGVMLQMQRSEMDVCAAMSGMDDQPSSALSAVAADCCTYHAPSLTEAKSDLLQAPLQHAAPWLAWMSPVVLALMPLSKVTAESPPELTSDLRPPTYIVLSTLRV